jgi:hypothetical protein
MKLSVLVVAAAIVVAAILYEHRAKPLLGPGIIGGDGPEANRATPSLPGTDTPPVVPVAPDPQASLMAQASNFMAWRKNSKTFSPEEKAALEKMFDEKLKPAVEKWCGAYAGHVPFKSEDLTMANFVERIGNERFMTYTFVLNGITIGVEDSNKPRTVLRYVASRPEMQALNQLPSGGAMPSLNMPITQEEIIRMVKADTGAEFEPSEIEMRPTAAASALDGGAFVHIGHVNGDSNNGLYKLDFVFGPDGKIVNYERDPTF